jgi:hypothetical protein
MVALFRKPLRSQCLGEHLGENRWTQGYADVRGAGYILLILL